MICDALLNIKAFTNGPWALIGDFNEILHPYEKVGGNHGNSSRMHDFVDFIDNCQLLELKYFGLPFTWFNKREYSSSIFAKSYRVLINEQWISSFKDVRVENLLIVGSDHESIVLHLDKRSLETKPVTPRNIP